MLVAFTTENFRSCRDAQTINLLASRGQEISSNTIDPAGVAGLEGQRLLKSVAIFGSNASGKSNIVKAFEFFFRFISRSATDRSAGADIEATPFLLNREAAAKPSSFKATFVVNNVLYEYAFSVTRRRVVSEELVAFPKKIGRRLFKRWVDDNGETKWLFSRTHFHRDKELEARTRENALYLSVAAQFNHAELTPIYRWAAGQNYLVFVAGAWREGMWRTTAMRCAENKEFCEWVGRMLRDADIGITGLQAKIVDGSSRFPEGSLKTLPENVRRFVTNEPHAEVFHRIDGTDDVVAWSLEEESDGTQQLFSLLNSWDGMLRSGRTAVVDELDASLHARLTRSLLKLVHSPESNPHGGQLVFTSHDTSLLDVTLLRRDQVYFTEKDQTGATHLRPLLDFKPRKDEPLQKGYLAGRFGGVPQLGGFDIGAFQSRQGAE